VTAELMATARPMATPQPADGGEQVTWAQCGSCGALVYRKRLARNLQVCPECGFHHRLTALERIGQLADEGTFMALPACAEARDVLAFTDTMPYSQRLARAREATGLDEAVVCGMASVGGRPLVLAVMDFRFMGGSLSTAVGERIAQAADLARARSLPLLIVTASGGARMQEGCLSLMQMASTSEAIARMREAGLLTISLITDPTYGGVAASFATNADIIIAETGARMGFAGPRVIKQTIRQELPPGFQTAEFLLRHGQVDMVESRPNLRPVLTRILAATDPLPGPTGYLPEPVPGDPQAAIRDPRELPARDPWQTVKRARTIERPTTQDYLIRAFDSFAELHGDRVYGDCPSIVAGLARLGDFPVAVIGHQKGHSTSELVGHNFGMPQPEGYRKALRVMKLAARLGIPVVTLVDTPGAYPGVDAEERGQARAIADCILEMSRLPVPVVTVVTGEGGSGGALALGVADEVLMLENAVYSVISPEGCSSILWNTPSRAADAARSLHIVAPDLLRLRIVDGVIAEPAGGAHTDHEAMARTLRRVLLDSLTALGAEPLGMLLAKRRARFRRHGRPPTVTADGTAAGQPGPLAQEVPA
jgi:acetyl-CoA carboxylase carboxyl transferase subunit beta